MNPGDILQIALQADASSPVDRAATSGKSM